MSLLMSIVCLGQKRVDDVQRLDREKDDEFNTIIHLIQSPTPPPHVTPPPKEPSEEPGYTLKVCVRRWRVQLCLSTILSFYL